jgi:signal transduction histidine kinase
MLVFTAAGSLLLLVMFAGVYVSAMHSLSVHIDRSVTGELNDVRYDSRPGTLADFARVVRQSLRETNEFHYLLEDASGRLVAGDMPAIPPQVGIVHLSHEDLRRRDSSLYGVQGRGVRAADRAYLFVGVDTLEFPKLRAAATSAFGFGIGIMMLLAVVTSAVGGAWLLRRIETISRTSREIMDGDLGRRIPLRGADDEFDHLAGSLNAMLDRIQALMKDLEQVSNDIAHDLRTPLARLRQKLEAAQDAATADAMRAALADSIADVDGILDTFAAILRIAQIGSGSRKANFARIDFSELLDGLVETYRVVAETKGQTLSDAIRRALFVEGDRELLTQMVANLLENAINHTPPGVAIALEASRTTDGVRIVVADRGAGIPVAYRQKIFERFFRLEPSRSAHGNGLGLSLVAAIAELHGATVTLEDNRPGLRAVIACSAAARPVRVAPVALSARDRAA